MVLLVLAGKSAAEMVLGTGPVVHYQKFREGEAAASGGMVEMIIRRPALLGQFSQVVLRNEAAQEEQAG